MIARRELLGLGSAAFASCARSDTTYFGNTAVPATASLVHILNGDIDTLDPARSVGSYEFYVAPAVLEGLTQYHPESATPMAALATHYEANADCTEYRFYLRGHPAPKGTRLPASDDLPDTFVRRHAPAGARPACWSDGLPITAHDFVYAWRRLVDPQMAAPLGYPLAILENAPEIIARKLPASKLGVRAPDDFTFVVHLRSSTPFFIEFITSYVYAAVPRHVIEAARRRNAESSWTDPEHFVASGAFTLREYRRYDRIRLVPNPHYYDAHLVGLQELLFIPVVDGTAVMNLYKAGDADLTPGLSLSPIYTPVLSRRKDYHATPGFGTILPCINTRRPPFDNVLLRYALNMAIDKKAVTDFLGPGYLPARSVVAPLPQYPQPVSLKVEEDGRTYDVLSFDVDGARSLLAKAGFPGGLDSRGHTLEVPYHFPMLPENRPKAEIVQQQWLRHLHIRAKLRPHEFNVHWRMVLEADYSGLADYALLPLYRDPNGFLDQFANDADSNPTGWFDPRYVAELQAANAILNRTERMKALAACEQRLLAAMPFLPIYHPAWGYLCKPFVRGLASHPFDVRAFKYVWIDRNWRPS